MIRLKTIATFLPLLSVLALYGCKKEQPKEAEPVVPVQVTAVQRDSIRRMIEAEGILHPKDQAGVTPKISAPVKKFYVNRGDRVKAGQLLAELENRDLAASVTDAKGAFQQAQASYRITSGATVPDEVVKAQQDVNASKQAMDAAEKVVQSREQLFREGALARRLVDDARVTSTQARSTYETAQKHLESVQSVSRLEEVKGSQGQVESAKGKYDAAVAQLGYAAIRSPINGVVTDRPLYAGEMAAAGTPVITVMDISRVVARATIPVSLAAFAKVGNPASMTQTGTDIEVPGKITVVSPAVDPNSTTVEVWVEAANPGGRLRPGITVHLSMLAETIPDAIVVPVEALLPSQSGGSVLMVVGADSVAHERKIEIGAREPTKVQIVKGIQAGESVVIQGGIGLADGAKVRVRKAGEKDEDDDKDTKDEKEKK